ncbi:hypothetical protein BY996DRAFT_4573648 [Phakopsora pachyrhizi]|nr:hypothetical protein BY996DRAFT_4573648 [Phakopsora pachyrhizi]
MTNDSLVNNGLTKLSSASQARLSNSQASQVNSALTAGSSPLTISGTNPQPNHTSSSFTSAMASSSYRPLNVRDALSYLDQVKLQFQDSPGVYNKFLDIMKDFKTQVIDTPGVIDGVSSLFRGHPALIQGFNTFLPPGYRIDVSKGDTSGQAGPVAGYSLITVTHPMGVQTQKRVPLASGGEEIGSHVIPEGAVVSSTAHVRSSENARGNDNHNSSYKTIISHRTPSSTITVGQSSATDCPTSLNLAAKSMSISLDAMANHTRFAESSSGNTTNDASKPTVKPLEFNHAITYVNKIKNRYAGDPKTYQTFLDILQTYQRDARPIQEVYEQVNQLFRGAPDLLAEFMQFLPDNSGTGNQLPVASQSGLLGVPSVASGPSDQPEVAQSLPENRSGTPSSIKRGLRETQNSSASTSSNNDGKNPTHSHGTLASSSREDQVGSSQPPAKRRRHANANSENTNAGSSDHHVYSNASSALRNQLSISELGAVGASGADNRTVGSLSQANIAKGKKRNHRLPQRPRDTTAKSNSAMDLPPPGFAPPGFNTIGEAYFSAKTTNEALAGVKRKKQEPIQNFTNLAESDSKETTRARHSSKYLSAKGELMFFQHLKTYFEDQKTYIELLKIINLFTQDLIDLETLVYRVKPFLINCPELFMRFTEIVGWREGAMMPQMNGSVNSHLSKKKKVPNCFDTRPVLSELERLPESGPSYRKLPESDAPSACSGRDALCWEVLNDEWVCGPPGLTVEEQVFLPRQTNAFERALYQAEDERHEYDYHIEANVRTIALLEPINLRIQQMDPETRAEYRLKPGLGGQSKSVYQRIIKKIYGKEQGAEVIQALHDNPAVAVPIVLARLKQKDEEWKKALRDWNRVWREVDGKNYWKALDHQGISFKTIDKKMISNKNLVNEIDLIKREQQQRRKIAMNPSIIRFLPKYQLELDFKCFDVFYDILKVFIHFLDHVPRSTGLDDHHKDRIETTLKSILVAFFDIPTIELEKHLVPLPPDRKAQDGLNSNTGRNADADGNETVCSEGDISDTPGGVTNVAGCDDRQEGSNAGRPTRGATAGRKRGGAKDSTNGTASSDLRKRAMKNASNGGLMTSERASARRSEANKAQANNVRRSYQGAEETGEAGDGVTTQVVSSHSRQSLADSKTKAQSSAYKISGEIEVSSVRDESPGLQETSPSVSQSKNKSFQTGPKAVNVDASNQGEKNYEAKNGLIKLSAPRIQVQSEESPKNKIKSPKHNFFTNNAFYCFFRLLHILYTRFNTLRLDSLKTDSINTNVQSKQQQQQQQQNSEISRNSISPPSGPGQMSKDNNFERQNGKQVNSYIKLLSVVQSFNSGSIDQSTFEDDCRNLFGTKGYLMITVDKLCQALVKVLAKLSNDEASKQIFNLFQENKNLEDKIEGGLNQTQRLSYRKSVETLTGGMDTKLYRIEWVPIIQAIRVQLIGGDDINPEDYDSVERAWSRYIESYSDMSIERTIGLDGIKVKEPFLKRNLKLVKGEEEERMSDGESVDKKLLEIKKQFISRSGLGIRVCMRSYRLFFSTNTFEYLIRIKKETNKLSIEGTNNMKVKKKRKKKAGEEKGEEDIEKVEETVEESNFMKGDEINFRKEKFERWLLSKHSHL